jgi:hypothetical protein
MTARPIDKPKLPRLPYILLGLMTLFSFGGPLAFGFVLAGGKSDRWPPDRPAEWATLIGISAVVVILMLLCLSLAWWNLKSMKPVKPTTEADVSRLEP